MQYLGTNTAFLSPWQGREEQTAFMHVLLMIGTMVSHNSGILASKGNLVSSIQAGSTRNTLSALTG